MRVDTMARDVEPGDKVVLDVKDVQEAKGGKVVILRTSKGELAVGARAHLEAIRQGRPPAGFGGDKGSAIIAVLRNAPPEGMTPEEVAGEVGCSPARVYEVIRAVGARRLDRGHYRVVRRGRKPA